MMKTFTRTIEDFTCLHCGATVRGNGYTNHCPHCLWSRDVDINPGDRASSCGGAMRPVGVDLDGGKYVIIHKCEKCGKVSRIHATAKDDFNEIIKLSANDAFLFGKR
ncbi:MAG: RNHCP domain-containing protein [Proteobacteria bacterium]|nr:RNHCP domain-containing protein [Pseudomonadota bacterium]